MTRRASILAVSLLVSVGPAGEAHAASRQEAFALIVTNSRSLNKAVSPLLYADDDGARFYELTSSFATKAILLSVLDEQTQKTFPALAKISRQPTRRELIKAMGQIRTAVLQARKRGSRTVFYFYFAGHGDVGADRQGYINLQDKRFSRADLYREVIARSPADLNHVIIDACNAYFLVNRRGGGGRESAYQAAMRSFLASESLSRHPNTGVLLSTATMAETHEWSRYRSGIFSHQVLSALYGSADVNGDGRVDYHEVAAYVAAANLKVRDSRARLSIFSRAPRSDLKAALVNLGAMKKASRREVRPASGKVGTFLKIPRSLAGHYYLEDDRGVRYMDFNKSTEQPLRLALLDRPYYYLRSRTREAKIDMGGPLDLDAGRLTFADIPTRSRGSVEQSLRQDLYAFPFGRSFAAGHATAHGTPSRTDAQHPDTPPTRWHRRLGTWKWIAAGTATAALATGITLQVLANDASAELESGAGDMTMSRAVDLQHRAQTRQTWAGITFGVAATAAVLTTTLFILDYGSSSPRKRSTTSVGVMAYPKGAAFSFSRNFGTGQTCFTPFCPIARMSQLQPAEG